MVVKGSDAGRIGVEELASLYDVEANLIHLKATRTSFPEPVRLGFYLFPLVLPDLVVFLPPISSSIHPCSCCGQEWRTT